MPSNVVPFRRPRPGSRLVIREGSPPKLVAMAKVVDGVIVVKLRSEELTPSEAEALGRGLLTLADSAKLEGKER